jgi:2'-5' RNA ligase
MAEAPTTYLIGLSIPPETQEELQRYGTMLADGDPSIVILGAGNYRVTLMSVESQSQADFARIQRVFDTIQRQTQGYSFSITTKQTCVYRNRTVAAFKVRSCGVPLPDWAQQGSLGHLRRLFAMLHRSLTQEGIAPQHMTREDQYCPVVVFARIQDGHRFENAPPRDIPEESQVQWQTSPNDLIIGEIRR